jgi:hypothetical protein
MEPDRFRRIRSLFDAALEHETANRAAFVENACAGDEELCREVKRLLAAQGKTFPVLDSASALSSVRRVKEAAAAGQVIGRSCVRRELLRR